MMYWTCPYCKSHLDFGEKCDCKNKEKLDCNRGALHGDDKIKDKKENDYGKCNVPSRHESCS